MNNWIDVKEKLPPNNLIVEVQCSDTRGRYWMAAKYVVYKHRSKKRKRVDGCAFAKLQDVGALAQNRKK